MLFKHFCVYYLQNCILFAFLLDISMDVKTQNQSCLWDLSEIFGKERSTFPFQKKSKNRVENSTLKLFRWEELFTYVWHQDRLMINWLIDCKIDSIVYVWCGIYTSFSLNILKILIILFFIVKMDECFS